MHLKHACLPIPARAPRAILSAIDCFDKILYSENVHTAGSKELAALVRTLLSIRKDTLMKSKVQIAIPWVAVAVVVILFLAFEGKAQLYIGCLILALGIVARAIVGRATRNESFDTPRPAKTVGRVRIALWVVLITLLLLIIGAGVWSVYWLYYPAVVMAALVFVIMGISDNIPVYEDSEE